MAESKSLADHAVEVLALVKAMDANITNSDPHRALIRNMKRVAEEAIAQALQRAGDLAWLAQEAEREISKAKAEARPLTEHARKLTCAKLTAPAGTDC